MIPRPPRPSNGQVGGRLTEGLRAPRPARWLPALLALLLSTTLLAAQEGPSAAPVEITFLDVGQGDAVLIRTPEGRTALIDAGPGSVLDQLRARGVEALDLVVASHPHADHIGGMAELIESMPVRFFMDNGRPHTTATYLGLMRAVEARPDITYLEAVPRSLSLGSVELRVLPLPPGAGEHNDRSVGLVLAHGDFRALFSGDSERAELGFWTARGAVPDVTLLKAPHHGSHNGFTPALLAAARPEVVVISVGANSYGHPRPEALAAYAGAAAEVYRTDVHGPVQVLGHEDGTYDTATLTDASGRVRARYVYD